MKTRTKSVRPLGSQEEPLMRILRRGGPATFVYARPDRGLNAESLHHFL